MTVFGSVNKVFPVTKTLNNTCMTISVGWLLAHILLVVGRSIHAVYGAGEIHLALRLPPAFQLLFNYTDQKLLLSQHF